MFSVKNKARTIRREKYNRWSTSISIATTMSTQLPAMPNRYFVQVCVGCLSRFNKTMRSFTLQRYGARFLDGSPSPASEVLVLFVNEALRKNHQTTGWKKYLLYDSPLGPVGGGRIKISTSSSLNRTDCARMQ